MKELPSLTETIKANTRFYWKAGEPRWAGLTPSEITDLTIQIAALIGITNHRAKKIRLNFADHLRAEGSKEAYIALCRALYHSYFSEYFQCNLIFNRSLEVRYQPVNLNIKRGDDIKRGVALGVLDQSLTQPKITCDLKTPLEVIIWLISEELKHANTLLMAGNRFIYDCWQKKYSNFLVKKGFIANELYSVDIDELAASRVATRIQKHFAPAWKKPYFHRLYQRSLQTRQRIVPCFPDSAFIKTGYRNPLFG